MQQNEAFEKYLDQLADHFARMAQVDGFRNHAAYRLDELSKDTTFIGLQNLVLSKIADSIVEMSQKEDKEPARQLLRELVKDKSGMFTKLPALVKEKLENFNKELENGNA